MSTSNHGKRVLQSLRFWRLPKSRRYFQLAIAVVVTVIAAPGVAFALFSFLPSAQTAGVTASMVAPPRDFSASAASSTTATLSWTAPPNLTGYTLSQSPGTVAGGGASPCGATLSASTTSCTAADLVPGTSYTWTLVANYDQWNSSSVETSATAPKETPTITTTDKPSSLTVGGSGDDQATVSSGYFTSDSTGTITFELYDNSSCTGTPLFTDTPQTVTAITTYTSNSFTTAQAETDYWYFSYSGDTSNNAVSECGGTTGVTGETLTVNKASPTLTTTASSTTISSTATISDSADLEQGYNPTGTISFALYSDSACGTTALYTHSVTVNGNGNSYSSGNYTPSQAGTYYWTATYNPEADTNNNGVSDACGSPGESSVVSKASPAISTTATPTSITLGGSGADQATLTGGYSPTGTMTFTLYQGSCGGSPVFTTTQSTSQVISGNTVYTSPSYTPTAAGTYYWSASYPGDTNNNGANDACSTTNSSETLTVNKTSPSLSTTLNQSGITVGGTDSDTASLTGAVDILAGGTVTYSYYTNNTCTLGQVTVNQVSVGTNGSIPSSSVVTFNSASTYYWQAVYSGDANNNGASSSCTATNNEQLTVSKTSPGASTTLQVGGNINAGGADSDSASIAGVTPTAGGTVSFTIYTDSACTVQATTGSGNDINAQPTTTTGPTNNGSGTITAGSSSVTFLKAGTYYWQAVYSGDANNNGASSTCGSESLTVTAAISASDIGDNSSAPCAFTASNPTCVGPSVATTSGHTDLIFIYDEGSKASNVNATSVTCGCFSANAAQVTTVAYPNSHKNELDVWVATGAGSTGSVTANFGSNETTSDMVITVVQLSGNNVGAPVSQLTTNVDATGSATASTTAFTSGPATGDGEIVFFGANNNVTVSTPSGLTKLLEVNNTTGSGSGSTGNAEGIYFSATAQQAAVSSTLGGTTPWGAVALDLAHS